MYNFVFLLLFFLLRPVFLKDWLVDYKCIVVSNANCQ